MCVFSNAYSIEIKNFDELNQYLEVENAIIKQQESKIKSLEDRNAFLILKVNELETEIDSIKRNNEEENQHVDKRLHRLEGLSKSYGKYPLS